MFNLNTFNTTRRLRTSFGNYIIQATNNDDCLPSSLPDLPTTPLLPLPQDESLQYCTLNPNHTISHAFVSSAHLLDEHDLPTSNPDYLQFRSRNIALELLVPEIPQSRNTLETALAGLASTFKSITTFDGLCAVLQANTGTKQPKCEKKFSKLYSDFASHSIPDKLVVMQTLLDKLGAEIFQSPYVDTLQTNSKQVKKQDWPFFKPMHKAAASLGKYGIKASSRKKVKKQELVSTTNTKTYTVLIESNNFRETILPIARSGQYFLGPIESEYARAFQIQSSIYKDCDIRSAFTHFATCHSHRLTPRYLTGKGTPTPSVDFSKIADGNVQFSPLYLPLSCFQLHTVITQILPPPITNMIPFLDDITFFIPPKKFF